MKIYLIGTGTEGCRTLTAEAADAVACAGLLIGAKRMLAPYRLSGKDCVCAYQPEEIAELLKNSTHQTAAVLFSGDTGFFSGAKKLLPLLDGADVTVLPGISSAAAFFALLGKSYEQVRYVSLHGANASIAIHAAANPICFFLLGGEMRAADVCKRLCAYGLGEITVRIGQDLGYPYAKLHEGKAADFTGCSDSTLTVLMTENPDALRYLPSAIPDDRFQRGQVPMTKAQVRCCITASLNIRRDGICWDIGCGTGSVSVEMACRCPDGLVYAFDRDPEAVRLTSENAARFCCDNIIAAEGVCPDCLQDAPAPDHVFIGGSSGHAAEIFAAIAEKNPAAIITAAAVTLESLHRFTECFKAYGAPYSVTQIAVTDTRQIGGYTMLNAQNPVFLIGGQLLCGAS